MRYVILILLLISTDTFAESFADTYKRYTGDYPRGSIEYEREYTQRTAPPNTYTTRTPGQGTMWYTPPAYSNQYGTSINSYGSNGQVVNCYATRYGVTCSQF